MDKRAYYYYLKCEARRRVLASLNRRIKSAEDRMRWSGLTLCSIFGTDIGNALDFAENEWAPLYKEDTHPGFSRSWKNLAYSFANAPDHFDLAIWQQVNDRQVLVAMALGNPSNARTHLTVKWAERYFGHNHLAGRALWPILTCAEEYAKLLGSKRVLLKDPVDPAKYERYGYARYRHPDVAHGGNYLCKEV
jgi:hypothetical protein